MDRPSPPGSQPPTGAIPPTAAPRQKRSDSDPSATSASKRVRRTQQPRRRTRRRRPVYSTQRQIRERRAQAELRKNTAPEPPRIKSEPRPNTWNNLRPLFQRGSHFPKSSFGSELDIVSWKTTSMTEADHEFLKEQIKAYRQCTQEERARWLEERMTPQVSNGIPFAALKDQEEVIAARNIKQWELLGHYAGEAYTNSSIKEAYKKYGTNNIDNYLMQAGEDYVISAFNKSNVCSLINAGKVYATELQQEGRVLIHPQRQDLDDSSEPEELVIPNNVIPMFATCGREIYVFIVSNRDIKKDEILWLDYGIDYWRRLQLPIELSSDSEGDASDMEVEETSSSITLTSSANPSGSLSPSNETETAEQPSLEPDIEHLDDMHVDLPEVPPITVPATGDLPSDPQPEHENPDDMQVDPPVVPPIQTQPPEEDPSIPSPAAARPDPVYPDDIQAMIELMTPDGFRQKIEANLEQLKAEEIDFRKFYQRFTYYSKTRRKKQQVSQEDLITYIEQAGILTRFELLEYISLTAAVSIIEKNPDYLDPYLVRLWQKGKNLTQFCSIAKNSLLALKEDSEAPEWRHADLLSASSGLNTLTEEATQEQIDQVYEQASKGTGDDTPTTQLLILAHKHKYALRKYIQLKLTSGLTDKKMVALVKAFKNSGVPLPDPEKTRWSQSEIMVFFLKQTPENDPAYDALHEAILDSVTIKAIISVPASDPMYKPLMARIVQNWLKKHKKLTDLFENLKKVKIVTPEGLNTWTVPVMGELLKEQKLDCRIFPTKPGELATSYEKLAVADNKNPMKKGQSHFLLAQISNELLLRAYLGETEAMDNYIRLQIKFHKQYEDKVFRDFSTHLIPAPAEVGEWTLEKVKGYIRHLPLTPSIETPSEQPMEEAATGSSGPQPRPQQSGSKRTLSQRYQSDSDDDDSDYEPDSPSDLNLCPEEYSARMQKVMQTWTPQKIREKLDMRLEGIRDGSRSINDIRHIFRYREGDQSIRAHSREILHYLEQEKLITHEQSLYHLTAEMALERIQSGALELDEYLCHLWKQGKKLYSFLRETGGRLGFAHGFQDTESDARLLVTCPGLTRLISATPEDSIDTIFHRNDIKKNDEAVFHLLLLAHKHNHALKRFIEYRLRHLTINKVSLKNLADRLNKSGVPVQGNFECWTPGAICHFYLSHSSEGDDIYHKMLSSMTISGLKGLTTDHGCFRNAVTHTIRNLLPQKNNLSHIMGQLKGNNIPVPFDNAQWNAKTMARLLETESFQTPLEDMLSEPGDKLSFWATEALVRAFNGEDGAFDTYIKIRMRCHGSYSKLASDLNENDYLTPQNKQWTSEFVKEYITRNNIVW